MLPRGRRIQPPSWIPDQPRQCHTAVVLTTAMSHCRGPAPRCWCCCFEGGGVRRRVREAGGLGAGGGGPWVLGRRAVGAPPAGYLIRKRGRHRSGGRPRPLTQAPLTRALPFWVNPAAVSPAPDKPVLTDPIYTDWRVYESRSPQVSGGAGGKQAGAFGWAGRQVSAGLRGCWGGRGQITGGRPARAIRQAVRREMGRRGPGSIRQPSAKPANQGRRLPRRPRSLAAVSAIQSAR